MSTPEVRLFQFGGNNVNMFRGDVNTGLTLISLPSRSNLDVTVNLAYQSNIHDSAFLWNLEAPTGIIGLGWSLSYERIQLVEPSLVERRYALVSAGSSSLLNASDEAWILFNMGLEFKTSLQQGRITYELREQFALNSVPLSENCRISGGENGPWIIKDDDYETVFIVNSFENSLEVSAGGQGFELQNYQFWKIRYYSDYEKWVIVKESGLVSTYGGLKTKTNNTLQWGVKWGNWIGSSSLIEGQEQYPVAWNLSSHFNSWGDKVNYIYEAVEQSVGNERGQSYTKACYISSIIDVFKRKVLFHYKEKEEGEFMDPHKTIPNNEPNSYQDRYETKYLDRIEVKSSDDTLLFAFQFLSELKNVIGKNEGEPLYRETSKRFLTGIIQENAEGESLPGVQFDYYFENTDPNPGALKSITNPQGGISTYTYRREDLPLCHKSIAIHRPIDESLVDWVPRIWYGSDYAVVAWYNEETYALRVSVYTWLGYWYKWTSEILNIKVDLILDSLTVLPLNDSFALYYANTRENITNLFLLHKLENSLGQWIINDQAITYSYNYTRVKIYGGNDFFAVLNTDKSQLDRYTWDWRYRLGSSGNPWKKENFYLPDVFNTSDNREYYLAASTHYYIILSHSPNEKGNILKIFYLNNLGDWFEGGTSHPNDIQISGENFFWSLGETFAVATYVTSIASSFYEYEIQIFHWDENYQFTSSFKKPDLKADQSIQFIPALVDNSFIGSGPYLFRFNGKEWQQKKIELEIPIKSGNLFWFSYVRGLALATEDSNAQVISLLAVYDPNIDTLLWENQPIQLENTEPFDRRTSSYFPTTSTDFISVGKKIYYRGSSTNWVSSTQRPIYEIPVDEIVNTTTMYNQSPQFFSYLQLENKDGELIPTSTKVLNLENGNIKNIETFEEKIFQIYDSKGYLKANLNGKIPVGADVLATYGPIDAEWNQAEFITLRRCLNAAVKGMVTDYSVITIEVDDGFDKTYTCYEYDLATASCDPSGKVVKYYTVRTYAGCKDKSESQDGYTKIVYINGLPGDTEGIHYPEVSEFNNSQQHYSVLDGFIESQNTYDASDNLVASQKNDWFVKIEKLNQKGEVIPIRGYYTLLNRATNTLQGVQTLATTSYDLFSGQVILQETTNYNSRGQLELWTQETTYGYQKYPLLGALNILSTVVSNKIQVQENQNIAISNYYVTRLKSWERIIEEGAPALSILAINDNYQWLGGDREPSFTAWNEDQIPGSDWQRGSAITARSNHGLSLEVQDIMNKYASSLYDKDFKFLIASFSNAKILDGEADYLGFEAYEEGRGWNMMPSHEPWSLYIDSSTAHTGKKSLKLSVSTTGYNALEKKFTPITQDTKYLFTFWYKTVKDFSQNREEAGCKIALTQNGEEIFKTFLPFENTAEEWSYITQAIDLKPYVQDGIIEITMSLYNKTSADVFLDNLRFSPFLGDFSASIYNSSYGLLTASVGPNKETSRNVYDNFQLPVATIGPDENVNGITLQYYSRQKNNTFSTAFPNALITLSGMEKGFYSDFRRDGGYSLHWTTEEENQWFVDEGTLLHSGQNTGKIYLTNPLIDQKYAVYVIANPRESITKPLGILIGENASVQWNPATNQWRLEIGQTVIESAEQQSMQREWLLAIYDKVVLFFANGEIIFSTILEENLEGNFGLLAENTVDFSRIIVTNEFQLSLSYSDGANKERQSQLLFEEESVINQTVYDNLGRAAISTKSAKLAPTENNPLLSYRSDFVTSLNWDTGVMSGEVSQYYAPGGGGSSNDEGYPYSRSRYESSPLGRVIEKGIPGKDFAIVNLSTTTPEERHTTKISYFANRKIDSFMDWLPEGQYFTTQTINSDGNLSLSLTDQSKNLIGQGILVDKEEKKYNMTSYQGVYSNVGKKTLTLLPNYYDPPNPNYQEKWQVTTDLDMLSCIISSEGPDGGKVETIYDLSGAVRFSQNAEGRDKGYYSYSKYDEIGRLIEDGIIEGIWDRLQLHEYAKHDPSWPSTPSTWGRKLTYDGDGSNPYLMSRLISVIVHGDLESNEASNQQAFDYNISGNIIKQTLEIFKDNTSYTTSYRYNNKSKLVHVTYPSTSVDTSLTEYSYIYNQGGILQSIYSPTNDIEYASYVYNADGSLKTETLVNALPAKVERTFEYISPGWLKKVADSYYSQEMYYTKDANGNLGYYTGLIAEERFQLLKTTPINVTPSYAYRYTYDSLGRLTVAENRTNEQINPRWSIGINSDPITYDSNGNFLALKTGDIQRNYIYNPGTDEIKNTIGDESRDYDYNLIGATTAAKEKGIDSILYNRASGKEDIITTTTEEVKFEYNGRNQRILKSSTALSKLYLHGLNANPLMEKITQIGLPQYDVLYVYGQNGKIGFIRDNKFYLILPDRQGSSRILLNEEGVIEAAYTYLPFGGFMDDPQELIKLMSYFYTSQEWDEETKLYNYKARFYDSQIGRFFSTDAAGQGASPYIYCTNNPILFTDPSGNIAWEAGLNIGLGILTVIGGIALTIFTVGAAAPVAIGGALTAGAFIGGGTSSAFYSGTHLNNWNVKDWGINVAIGSVSGLVSGGLGMGGGAAASAAASTVENLAARGTISFVAGAVTGAAGDSAVNVLGTLAYNGISGAPLNSGLGNAAIAGAVGGAIGGGLGGFAGFLKQLRGGAALRADSRDLFLGINMDEETRAVGIWNINSREMELGQFEVPLLDPNANNSPRTRAYAPVHAQLARFRYGEGGIRNTPAGPRATYPNLKGFHINKTGPNSADVGFNSQTLNGFRGFSDQGVPNNDGGALLDSPTKRMQILMGLKEAGIRNSILPRHINDITGTEKFLMLFLKTPF